MRKNEKSYERRTDSRVPYWGHIFFATKDRLFEGVLINYSQHGVFIKTYEILAVGEFITMALPYEEDEKSKVPGQILWRNHEGYGVELVKKRNGDSDILRLESKLL